MQNSDSEGQHRTFVWAWLLSLGVLVIVEVVLLVSVRMTSLRWKGITFGSENVTWQDCVIMGVSLLACYATLIKTMSAARRRCDKGK